MANTPVTPLPQDANGKVSEVADSTGAAAAVRLNSDGSVPVASTSLPLPTGAATEATLAAESAKLPAVLGQTTKAASLSTTIASDQALPSPTGAANAASPVVSILAPTSSPATAVIARATRTGVLFVNTGTVTVYLALATVSAANGFPLPPGASVKMTSVTLIQMITASGTGALAAIDEFN